MLKTKLYFKKSQKNIKRTILLIVLAIVLCFSLLIYFRLRETTKKIDIDSDIEPTSFSNPQNDISYGNYYDNNNDLIKIPLKLDGTPDMRYKINKQLFGNKGSEYNINNRVFMKNSNYNYNSDSGPRKKDGTPDMRYKVNRQYLSGYYQTSSRRNRY